MAYALPMLVQDNPLWQGIIEAHQAGISLDFNQIHPQDLLPRIRQRLYYTSGVPADCFWDTEETKLLQIVKEALKINQQA
jgi:hypothetical protein